MIELRQWYGSSGTTYKIALQGSILSGSIVKELFVVFYGVYWTLGRVSYEDLQIGE